MNLSKLHIVSFDIPFPADYGGVMDVYHKIRHLHALGVKIHLHCFQYHRKPAHELNPLCEEVTYYPRERSIKYIFSNEPFIVATRKNKDLLNSLIKDDAPILFEGIHTSGFLTHELLREKQCVVRTHNIEHEYYEQLAEAESNPFSRWYLRREAFKLRRYEPVLQQAYALAAISPKDALYYQTINQHTVFIPPFHPEDVVEVKPGIGNYALYHGNLQIAENHLAAIYLLKHVFSKINYPLIIAGKNPRQELIRMAGSLAHVKLITPVSNDEMKKIIREAQIHVLPTFQATGIKLKLLHALYTGRHCLVNPKMIQGTGLDLLCHQAETADEWITWIEKLSQRTFSETELEKRKAILEDNYSNQKAAIRLMQLLEKGQ
ncbi:MAG: glycosyltransferase [Flavobacteriales bacterium]|nr:glycosyltransferase [Flavobacteriales bacterium]